MKTIISIIVVFLLGLYYYTNYSVPLIEGFDSLNCPNLLIQKGKKIYLKNTQKAEVPGVNPIIFNNLEEYVEFLSGRNLKISTVLFYILKENMIHKNSV